MMPPILPTIAEPSLLLGANVKIFKKLSLLSLFALSLPSLSLTYARPSFYLQSITQFLPSLPPPSIPPLPSLFPPPLPPQEIKASIAVMQTITQMTRCKILGKELNTTRGPMKLLLMTPCNTLRYSSEGKKRKRKGKKSLNCEEVQARGEGRGKRARAWRE